MTNEAAIGSGPVRHCVRCNREIRACNGIVKAGDMLDEAGNLILDFSNRPWPRELCGLCALAWEWTAEGMLVPTTDDYPEGWFTPRAEGTP